MFAFLDFIETVCFLIPTPCIGWLSYLPIHAIPLAQPLVTTCTAYSRDQDDLLFPGLAGSHNHDSTDILHQATTTEKMTPTCRLKTAIIKAVGTKTLYPNSAVFI